VRPAQVVALAAALGVVLALSAATAWYRAVSPSITHGVDEASEIDSSNA